MRCFGVTPRSGVVEWLLERHHPDGGFCASPATPLPDLLSTATALHALSGAHAPFATIREPGLDYIDNLWSNEGGFYGHLRHVRRPSQNPITRLARRVARASTLPTLQAIQPTSGGFLEATPLQSFVVMSLIAAQQGAQMLLRVVDLFQIGVVGHVLNPLLEGNDLVVKGYRGHRPKLQTFGAVHRRDRYGTLLHLELLVHSPGI